MTPIGPDIDAHVESLRQYEEAGVDELFVQQVGPDTDAFFSEWAAPPALHTGGSRALDST